MLFLGLGTGLGSAMIVENVLEPMELGHLPYKKGQSYEDYVGLAGLKRLGEEKWRHEVNEVVQQLKTAMQADYVVLGGGDCQTAQRTSARHAPGRQCQRIPRRIPPLDQALQRIDS